MQQRKLTKECLDDLTEIFAQNIIKNLSKKIVIFGAATLGVTLYELVIFLGGRVSYFIDSEKSLHDKNMGVIPVYDPLYLMYENPDDIFVIIPSDRRGDMVIKLVSMGLKEGIHFIQVSTTHFEPTDYLDFFLAFNRMDDLMGFKIFGKPEESNIKIVTLGGSTTDYSFIDIIEWTNETIRKKSIGSWPRFLYDILTNNGFNVSVYNGGMAGYTSSQEMLKVIRDCLPLKPDIIITFDGINDSQSHGNYFDHYPKYHQYVKNVDAFMVNAIKSDGQQNRFFTSATPIKGISYGLRNDTPDYMNWIENLRIIDGICAKFEIEYVPFLQPATWRDTNSDEENSQLDDVAQSMLKYNKMIERCEIFYKNASRLARESDFIIDLSDLFHEHDDVYYDYLHCTMKGNKIIAARIFDELSNRGAFEKVSHRKRRC